MTGNHPISEGGAEHHRSHHHTESAGHHQMHDQINHHLRHMSHAEQQSHREGYRSHTAHPYLPGIKIDHGSPEGHQHSHHKQSHHHHGHHHTPGYENGQNREPASASDLRSGTRATSHKDSPLKELQSGQPVSRAISKLPGGDPRTIQLAADSISKQVTFQQADKDLPIGAFGNMVLVNKDIQPAKVVITPPGSDESYVVYVAPMHGGVPGRTTIEPFESKELPQANPIAPDPKDTKCSDNKHYYPGEPLGSTTHTLPHDKHGRVIHVEHGTSGDQLTLQSSDGKPLGPGNTLIQNTSDRQATVIITDPRSGHKNTITIGPWLNGQPGTTPIPDLKWYEKL